MDTGLAPVVLIPDYFHILFRSQIVADVTFGGALEMFDCLSIQITLSRCSSDAHLSFIEH
jgi:hypothetical protein